MTCKIIDKFFKCCSNICGKIQRSISSCVQYFKSESEVTEFSNNLNLESKKPMEIQNKKDSNVRIIDSAASTARNEDRLSSKSLSTELKVKEESMREVDADPIPMGMIQMVDPQYLASLSQIVVQDNSIRNELVPDADPVNGTLSNCNAESAIQYSRQEETVDAVVPPKDALAILNEQLQYRRKTLNIPEVDMEITNNLTMNAQEEIDEHFTRQILNENTKGIYSNPSLTIQVLCDQLTQHKGKPIHLAAAAASEETSPILRFGHDSSWKRSVSASIDEHCHGDVLSSELRSNEGVALR